MTTSAHPDAEALSAHLDGEAPELAAHVASCDECRHRLDSLARVRAAVGTPVEPPDEARKDEAIAAAVAAVQPSSPSRQNWPIRLAAAVAAAAAVIVVGFVVTRVTSSHTSPAKALGPAAPDVIHGGDLGDVNDALALRAKIQPSLGGAASAAAQGAPADAGQAAPFRPGGAAAAQSTTDATASPAEKAGPAAAPRCEAEARKLQPAGAVLLYEATARWQGMPADVFGFSPPGAPATSSPSRPAPTRVYVLRRSDCQLLVFQSYAP